MPVSPLPPERQFDFWLGTWEAVWEGSRRGTNRISLTLDGQVVLEEFDGRPGMDLLGLSVSVWSEERGLWLQTWVDSSGGYYAFEGGFGDGVMDLRCERTVDGEAFLYRMRWHDIEPDAFQWDWERRPLAGGEWETMWHIDYRRLEA